MRHKTTSLLFIALLLSLSLVFAVSTHVVIKIYSAELVKLNNGKRLIYEGLDVPGKTHFFFDESKNANRQLVLNKSITIEYDVQKEDEKKRLLGYVYAGDIFVNAYLLKNGFALAHIRRPNAKYASLFISLQHEARKNRRGLWAYQDPNDEPYYIGSKSSKKFHRPGCRDAKELPFDKRVIFRHRNDALNQGYSQHWDCSPLFKIPQEVKK